MIKNKAKTMKFSVTHKVKQQSQPKRMTVEIRAKKDEVSMAHIVAVVEQLKKLGFHLSRHGCQKPSELLGQHPTDHFNEDSPKRVAEVMHWLETYAEPAKTTKLGSYSLKHIVERVSQYTANGEAIVGAILAGYSFCREQWNSINLQFFMRGKEKLSICEIRRHNEISVGYTATPGRIICLFDGLPKNLSRETVSP